MPCPHGSATATAERPRRTPLDYRTCRCRACRRICNERTGTPFNHLQYPTVGEELAEFEALAGGQVPSAERPLAEVGTLLIQARIAAGLTQRGLTASVTS